MVKKTVTKRVKRHSVVPRYRIELVQCKDCTRFGKIPHQNRYYTCGYSGARMMRKDGERYIQCPFYIDGEMVSVAQAKYGEIQERRIRARSKFSPKCPKCRGKDTDCIDYGEYICNQCGCLFGESVRRR